MVANEMARRFVSESVSVELQKSEGNRLNNTLIETIKGGIIRTPSGRGVFGGKVTRTTNAVDMKVYPRLILLAKHMNRFQFTLSSKSISVFLNQSSICC